MKCLVCNAIHEQNVCPRCGFPVVEIPGDYEAGLKALQPTVAKYRNDFAKKINVALVVHNYDYDNDLEYMGEEKLPFGNAGALMSAEKWLDVKFINVLSRKTFPVTLNVSVEGQPDYILTLEINNLPSETIQVGISLDESFDFRLIFRDTSGNTVSSDAMPLLK